jgi:hypothetical protein
MTEFQCKWCLEVFSCKKNLKRHIKNKHENQTRYLCPFCEVSRSRLDDLVRRHIKERHRDEWATHGSIDKIQKAIVTMTPAATPAQSEMPLLTDADMAELTRLALSPGLEQRLTAVIEGAALPETVDRQTAPVEMDQVVVDQEAMAPAEQELDNHQGACSSSLFEPEAAVTSEAYIPNSESVSTQTEPVSRDSRPDVSTSRHPDPCRREYCPHGRLQPVLRVITQGDRVERLIFCVECCILILQ